MIELTDVSKKFNDGTLALSGVNLRIEDGEFIFLIGSSGAGKTTFLKLILRELLPTSGKLAIDGLELAKMKGRDILALRRNIGFVFQDLKLLSDRNIYENVALSLEVLGKKPADIKKEVAEVLNLVGLKDYGQMFPAQLSGGELQRVAIARALAGNPKYLFADEPTGNVDPANGWKIIQILDKVNKNGVTVIMATHNSEIVDSLVRRVVRLDNGQVVYDKKGKYHEA